MKTFLFRSSKGLPQIDEKKSSMLLKIKKNIFETKLNPIILY